MHICRGYPDGMATTNPDTSAIRRFSIPLPRPLWIGVAAVVLVVVAVGLRIAVPIYRQQVAIREITRLRGKVRQVAWGPEWLRKRVTDAGVAQLKKLTCLEQVNLMGTLVTDAGVADLKGALPTIWITK